MEVKKSLDMMERNKASLMKDREKANKKIQLMNLLH